MQAIISLALMIILSLMLLSAYSGKIVCLGSSDYYDIKKVLYLITFLLSLFAYFLIPIEKWDLYRIHNLIDNLWRFGYEYAVNISEYKELIVINNYYYIISLLKNHDLAQLFVILADFIMVSHIFIGLSQKGEILDGAEFSFAFVVFLCFYDLTLAISGIRNVLAMTICATAIYYELYFNKLSFWITIPFYLVAFLIHPSSLFVLTARLLMVLSKKSKLFLLVPLFWSSLVDRISPILANSGIAQIEYLAEKSYYVNRIYSEDMRVLIVKVFIVLLMLFFCLIYKGNDCKKTSVYPEFVSAYSVMMLGGLTNVIFFQRMAYVYGLLIIPLLVKYIKKRGVLYYIVLAGASLVIFLMVYRFYNVITKGY